MTDRIGTEGAEDLFGGEGADSLVGLGGNDQFFGYAGDDTLLVGDGNDKLDGGEGSDILTGGLGRDVFVFDAALWTTGVDRITYFSISEDKIEFSKAVFKGRTESVEPDQYLAGPGLKDAKTADQRLIYETQSGALYYDEDGAGAMFAPVQIAIFEGAPALTSAVFALG